MHPLCVMREDSGGGGYSPERTTSVPRDEGPHIWKSELGCRCVELNYPTKANMKLSAFLHHHGYIQLSGGAAIRK